MPAARWGVGRPFDGIRVELGQLPHVGTPAAPALNWYIGGIPVIAAYIGTTPIVGWHHTP